MSINTHFQQIFVLLRVLRLADKPFCLLSNAKSGVRFGKNFIQICLQGKWLPLYKLFTYSHIPDPDSDFVIQDLKTCNVYKHTLSIFLFFLRVLRVADKPFCYSRMPNPV